MAESASGLELELDRPFQERLWVLQRVAWTLMALLVIAALAWLTGGGGRLANGTVQTADLTLEYPRISRWQAADQMVLQVRQPGNEAVEVMLGSEFGRLFTIESMLPQPKSSKAVDGGHRLTFELGSEPGSKTIQFALRPVLPALPTAFDVQVGQEPPLKVRTVVLP